MSEKIIKPGGVAAVPVSALAAAGKVVKAGSYDAAVEATQIVEAARAQAREILESAAQERESVIETARQEGYERGLQNWNAAVIEVKEAGERRITESEPELIRLAVRIAQKIIGEELRTSPEAIVGMARECLQGLGRERSLTLRVFPADLDLLRSRIGLLREAAGPNRSIEVVSDSTLGPGGCIVESEFGVIDARLETQIRCMEEILLRAARK